MQIKKSSLCWWVYITLIALIVAMGSAITEVNAAEEYYQFITRWGSFGIGDGQFYNPRGVAVDSSGNVYVTDMGNKRIQKFRKYYTFAEI